MSAWADAAATIHRAFADLEPISYIQAGVLRGPMLAVRIEEPAPTFDGPGRTLRTISYEIQQSDLPIRPVIGDTLDHRGRRWRVGDVTTLGDVGAWRVVVSDAGAIA